MAIVRVKSDIVSVVSMPGMNVLATDPIPQPKEDQSGKLKSEVKKETTVAASEEKVQPDKKVIISSVIAVTIIFVLSVFINSLLIDKGEQLVGLKLSSDVTIFAFLYIAAQAIERLLEPISSRILPTAEEIKNRDITQAKFENSKKEKDGIEAANAKAALAIKRANRTVVFWAIATCCGLIASSGLKLYLLTTIGAASVPRAAEILVTGLVIGGGTKPLHDLISRIEKAKTNAEDGGLKNHWYVKLHEYCCPSIMDGWLLISDVINVSGE